MRLTYLGNAGWEITDGKTVILVDPFLTQFARWTGAPGDADGPAPDALYPADTALINKHVTRADYILITHGHPDHALDAGYISRKTGATIIGHETAANLARAYGVTDNNLITVIGGEDYEFADATGTIRVEIDHKLWAAGQPVSDKNEVKLTGEFERKWSGKVKVDADHVEVLR